MVKTTVKVRRKWSIRMRVVRLHLLIFGSLVFPLSVECMTLASDLKNVVKDLYGGDGILLAPPPGPINHAPHFLAQSLSGLDDLSTGLFSGVGFLSFNSVVTGFMLDLETGEPVRIADSLGPLLGERATTLGKGRVNIGFTYTNVRFTDFEGDDLDDLTLTLNHRDANGDGILGPAPGPFDFELDQVRVDIDLEIEQDIYATFANYGLTSNWDVGIVVPIIHVRARADAVATLVDNSPTNDVHFFDPLAPMGDPSTDIRNSTVSGSKTGIGDVVFRTKYNLVRGAEKIPDLAIGGQIILPTGDADNLFGTGETRLQSILIASKSFGKITPHVNVGYEWAPGNSELHNLRYIVGLDAKVLPRVTAAFDFLGRWEPSGDGIGDETRDIAIGTRIELADNTLLTGNVQLPLNIDQGLRAEVIWTIGIEHTF